MKGCLEAEAPVELLTGPPRGLVGELLRLADAEPIGDLLRRHRTRVRSSVDAPRGVMLAISAAQAGRRAAAIVPNEALHLALPAMTTANERGLPGGGVASFFVTNSPRRLRWPSPRHALAGAGIAAIEPVDLSSLRHAVETSLALSRSALRPCAVIVHESLLHTLDTIACYPNRELEAVEVDAILRRRRRRRIRSLEGEGLLRGARRLEVNRLINVPSPGERVELGFISLGPAQVALRHVLRELQLLGRIPILELGLVTPLDEAVLMRFLDRCEQVIVLESRPGETEAEVALVADRLRRKGSRPALVFGREIPGDDARILQSDEALHPSVLARRLIHLLHEVRPAKQVASRLAEDAGDQPREAGSALAESIETEHLRRMLRGVADWLALRAPLEARRLEPTALVIDGAGREAPRTVRAEIFGIEAIPAEPSLPAIVAQLLWDEQNSLALWCCENEGAAARLERLMNASAPAERAQRLRIERERLDEPLRLRNIIREACLREGVTFVLVVCGERVAAAATPATRRAVEAIGEAEVETFSDIDRQGFQRREVVIQSAEEPCNIGPHRANAEPIVSPLSHSATGGVTYHIDELPQRLGAMWRLRLRPLVEQVEVVRSRPPMPGVGAISSARLPLPEVVHGAQPEWRAHFAGIRGEAPGIAVTALCEAGRQQGYLVRCVFEPTGSPEEGSTWAQVLFAHLGDESEAGASITARIPFGEADLYVAAAETGQADAAAAASDRHIAHPSRTYAAIDTGGGAAPVGERAAEALRNAREDGRALHDVSSLARTAFGTDRPADLFLLGICFQRGWIPLSPDAMEAGLAAMEARGFARCREAFLLGRHLAADTAAIRYRRRGEDATALRLLRRAALSMRQESRGLRRRAPDFGRLTSDALHAMPGLGESEAGRTAQRDFVTAMERLIRWGGVSYARQYRDLIVSLYETDRGDSGRALTRHAVLPLAESMLIRDAAYVASMSMSLASRRVIRHKLSAKPSRGDTLSRRFLNRFEAVAGRRRLRVDFRTSDWTAALMARVATVWPSRFRGSAADRERRAEMLRLISRAITEAPVNYAEWDRSLKAYHDLAAGGQLRHLSANALRLLAPDPIAEPTKEGTASASVSPLPH
jgi:hypothetical protein